jgi:hypothetical protein
MGSGAAFGAILILLGVALIFAGLFFGQRTELLVIGAVVAIAGAALGVMATRGGSSGSKGPGSADDQASS